MHLTGKAAIAWSFLREQLEAMNLDHMPDALALEFGCLAYAAALAAEEQLAREGSVIVVDGNPKTHPATRVRNQAWARFIQFTDRFGLSPRARESLSIDTAGDSQEELMALLSAPRAKKTASSCKKLSLHVRHQMMSVMAIFQQLRQRARLFQVKPKSPTRFMILLFCLTLGAELAVSESDIHTFHIKGMITDPSGTGMPKVEVSFRGERGTQIVFSDNEGRYEADLLTGVYTMSAQSPGFATYRRPIFRGTSSSTVIFNVRLPLGKIVNRDGELDAKKYDGSDVYPIPSPDGTPFELQIRYDVRTPTTDAIAYDGATPIDPVFVAYDLFSLRADHVIFNGKSHTVIASGNVVVEAENGTAQHADRLAFKFENGHATPVP